MSSLNRAMVIGNLGKDPEARHTQSGQMVVNLAIATNERWKDKASGDMKERTEWHNVVLWGRLAEIAEQYLSKGRQVYIDGRLQTRKWTDKDGHDRYTTEIVGSNMVLLGGRGEQSMDSNHVPQPVGDDDVPF